MKKAIVPALVLTLGFAATANAATINPANLFGMSEVAQGQLVAHEEAGKAAEHKCAKDKGHKCAADKCAKDKGHKCAADKCSKAKADPKAAPKADLKAGNAGNAKDATHKCAAHKCAAHKCAADKKAH